MFYVHIVILDSFVIRLTINKQQHLTFSLESMYNNVIKIVVKLEKNRK